MNKKRGLGTAIAFSALAVCTTYLEVNGYSCHGLWVVVVIWAFFGKF